MKDYFPNDYPCLQLSKYFLRFVHKICDKLEFQFYYNPNNNHFIISDVILGDNYKYYKTLKQSKEDKTPSPYYSRQFNWPKKHIILFNKEEPYEQHDGEWYYPDYHECNHDIEFKMTIPNLQKLMLCIFKNPILNSEHRQINEIFDNYTYDRSLYFPSENLAIDPKLDMLLISSLDKKNLLEYMLKDNLNNEIAQILMKKSDDYLIEFFKCFKDKKDLKFKDFICKVTNNQNTLTQIFEFFPDFKKYLTSNTPDNFLTKSTEKISIFKSYFNVENLSIKYHEKFNSNETQNCLLHILENSSFKDILKNHGICIHSVFYSYCDKSIISIIENNSVLPIEKIEQFFCDSLEYMQKTKKINYMEDNKDNIIKFFNYFYQNEISLLSNNSLVKKSIVKI